MTAGLTELARGEAVIIMDVDPQASRLSYSRMLTAWRGGADVVNMHRARRRDGENHVKKATAHFFHRIINRLSEAAF
jgi:dolichol-phosphate mannosyltransferase